MLDVCYDPTLYNECIAMVEAGNECQLTDHMSSHGKKLPWRSVARKCCSSQVSPSVA